EVVLHSSRLCISISRCRFISQREVKQMPSNVYRKICVAFLCLFAWSSCTLAAPPVTQRWTEKSAKEWYSKQPWLVGSNYIPASAINELEMWQADTFDPKRIDTELGWAESIGLNTMRVFLHDLLWVQDA